MDSLAKIKQSFHDHNSFLLIGHERPDGDSIGALLALKEILEGMNKRVLCVSKDPVPGVFSFLPGSSEIQNDFLLGDFDAVILLDNGDLRRTGFPERLAKLKKGSIPIINIDHHSKNDLWRMAQVNYADPEASSVCELLYKILTQLEISITPGVATSLLTGIFTDTGGFQHVNTTTCVLETTSQLLNKGAKLRKISENISNSRSVAMLKLWGIALSRLSVNEKWGLVYSVLTQEDIKSVGADEQEVSGLVNLINSIPNSQVALLLYETLDGKIKGSLRTESDRIDLSELATLFGGGGHKKASGFTIAGQFKHGSNGAWHIV